MISGLFLWPLQHFALHVWLQLMVCFVLEHTGGLGEVNASGTQHRAWSSVGAVEHPPPFPGHLALHRRPSPGQGSSGQGCVVRVLGAPTASQRLPVEPWVPELADGAAVLQAAVLWGSLSPGPKPRASGPSQASALPLPPHRLCSPGVLVCRCSSRMGGEQTNHPVG